MSNNKKGYDTMFEKVSLETYIKDLKMCGILLPEEDCQLYYNQIQIPKRSTSQSAGYDFTLPFRVPILSNTLAKVPTGIKVDLSKAPYPKVGKFLALYPRSSLAFNHGMRLVNTVGIIDQDYYNNPTNEGDIIVAFESLTPFVIEPGSKFVQGIIQPYYSFDDSSNDTKRIGGIGSTGK